MLSEFLVLSFSADLLIRVADGLDRSTQGGRFFGHLQQDVSQGHVAGARMQFSAQESVCL